MSVKEKYQDIGPWDNHPTSQHLLYYNEDSSRNYRTLQDNNNKKYEMMALFQNKLEQQQPSKVQESQLRVNPHKSVNSLSPLKKRKQNSLVSIQLFTDQKNRLAINKKTYKKNYHLENPAKFFPLKRRPPIKWNKLETNQSQQIFYNIKNAAQLSRKNLLLPKIQIACFQKNSNRQ